MTNNQPLSPVWQRKLGYRLNQFRTPGVYEVSLLMIVDKAGRRSFLLKTPSNPRLEDLGTEDNDRGGGAAGLGQIEDS